MKKDKDIKRDDIDFQYASSVVATKSFDNFGVAIIGTCLQDCNEVSSFTRRVKIPVPCPEIIKITTSVWVVLISSIKQFPTNWIASHLEVFINLDYFLI